MNERVARWRAFVVQELFAARGEDGERGAEGDARVEKVQVEQTEGGRLGDGIEEECGEPRVEEQGRVDLEGHLSLR